jgi:hypothetical protein
MQASTIPSVTPRRIRTSAISAAWCGSGASASTSLARPSGTVAANRVVHGWARVSRTDRRIAAKTLRRSISMTGPTTARSVSMTSPGMTSSTRPARVASETSRSAAISRLQCKDRATWGRVMAALPRSAALISRQTKPDSSTVPTRLIPVAPSEAASDSVESAGST